MCAPKEHLSCLFPTQSSCSRNYLGANLDQQGIWALPCLLLAWTMRFTYTDDAPCPGRQVKPWNGCLAKLCNGRISQSHRATVTVKRFCVLLFVCLLSIPVWTIILFFFILIIFRIMKTILKSSCASSFQWTFSQGFPKASKELAITHSVAWTFLIKLMTFSKGIISYYDKSSNDKVTRRLYQH